MGFITAYGKMHMEPQNIPTDLTVSSKRNKGGSIIKSDPEAKEKYSD